MAESKDKEWVETEKSGDGEDSSEKRQEQTSMGEKKEFIPVAVQPAVRPKTTRDVRLSDQSYVPKGNRWVVPQSDTMELLRHQFGEMTLRGLMDSGSVGRRQALASDSSSVNTSSPLEFRDSDIGKGLERLDLRSRRLDEKDIKHERSSM
ncbi:hypothetical protein E2320_022881, partial [Naja naja]